MFDKIRKNLSSAVKSFSFGGYGGQGYGYNSDPWGGIFRPLSGSQYDYRREVGIPWENSTVMACIQAATRTFSDAQLVLLKGTEQIKDHPALSLIKKPNPHYGSKFLWDGLLTSWMVDGNGYWFMERDGLSIPTELFYMPHFLISPRWPENGKIFIKDYAYRVNGKIEILDPKNVVHFMNGVNLQNTRSGQSPLISVLREICTENECATAAAAIMRNLGIPGLSFIPDPVGAADLTLDQKHQLRLMASEKMAGDRRGEMMIMPIPGKLEAFGFTPEQLAFDKIRRIPQTAITAAFGIPAMFLGLAAGLDASTYANYQEAREAFYESFLLPTYKAIADQLTTNILPAFGEDPDEMQFHFDTSNIKALNEPEDQKATRIREDWDSGIITLREAKMAKGFDYKENPETYEADNIYKWQIPTKSERLTETITEPASNLGTNNE